MARTPRAPSSAASSSWSRRGAEAADVEAVLALRDAALRELDDGTAPRTSAAHDDAHAFARTFAPRDWVLVESAEVTQATTAPGDAPVDDADGDTIALDTVVTLVAVVRVERRRHEILVHDLVVAQHARGQGIATAILRELIDEAVRTDVPVAIHVPPRAMQALRLLRFLGFVVVPSAVAGRARLVWRA